MAKWHGGKGSAVRQSSDQKKFESNWDAIFGNKQSNERELHESSGDSGSETNGTVGDNGNDTK